MIKIFSYTYGNIEYLPTSHENITNKLHRSGLESKNEHLNDLVEGFFVRKILKNSKEIIIYIYNRFKSN